MKLSDFEMDIMQLLWQQEPCTASELHLLLLDDERKTKKFAYTTVKTIVDRLEKKQAVERCGQQGRAIIYRSLISQKALSNQAVPTFMQRFFEGSTRSLIAHFIKQEELNNEDIEFLQTLLKDKKSNK